MDKIPLPLPPADSRTDFTTRTRNYNYVSFILLIASAFLIGLWAGRLSGSNPGWTGGFNSTSSVANLYQMSRAQNLDFDQFWYVWNKINAKYANQPVDETKLYYGAVEGLVNGLGDPYSVYFAPKKAEDFSRDLAGEFEGIGSEIGQKDGQLIVIAPLVGSPAEKAGLRPRDVILMIDGKDATGISVYEAVQKIRGPKGTTVKLLVRSTGAEVPREIAIIRARINIPSVVWSMKENNIAYIQVASFNENTDTEFDKIAKLVAAKKPRGIVLDLRSNPGGFLDRSVRVASEWIKSGVVVRERFVNNKINEYEAEGRHRLIGIPTVVLVDEGTASGSEIVAGALQDYGIAKIVGTTTYGKGSVQDYEVLPDGSALKLTVAKWYTPKDRQIDKIGIVPDVVITEMFVTSTTAGTTSSPVYIDKGLERAIELLR